MHESGEATSRQEDLRIKYSDSVEALDLLLCNMKERIKREEEEQL